MKICDFGLCRLFKYKNTENEINLSNEVVTKCYRPPEIILGNSFYDSKIDIWSLGCIFMELFTKTKTFCSHNSKEILAKIIVSVENYSEDDLEFIEDENAIDYIKAFKRTKKFELKRILEEIGADPQGFYYI